MKSTYAHGRASLPAPIITTTSGGSIQGNNATYYFWIKGRNRVGCNIASSVLALTVPNNVSLTIAQSTFATFAYEDWRYIYVYANTSNSFSTSHIVYKQELYLADQITPKTLTDVSINSNYALNGATEVAAPTNVAGLAVPNGYRIKVTSLNKIYEFVKDSTDTVDNVTVLAGTSGTWNLVSSNILADVDTNATKEIFQVVSTEFIDAPLPSITQDAVPIKYYIWNNAGASIAVGELTLNSYVSDSTITCKFDVEVLGYLSLDTYTLDTTSIDYVNTTVTYPDTIIKLSKPLPANSVFVIQVTPNINLVSDIVEGTTISLYPKLNLYSLTSDPGNVGDAVADIASLKALPSSVYTSYQSRYVVTQKQDYVFIPNSTDSDDGSTILLPNSNPSAGRWVIKSSSLAAGSVTLDKLGSDVIDEFTPKIKTTTVTIPSSQAYNIDLDAGTIYDYYIINTPTNDGNTTTINLLATLASNTTKTVILELRQNTGVVTFHSSLLFPGGNVPTLSGNNKTDMFVLSIMKDSTGSIKKRAFMVQKDIG